MRATLLPSARKFLAMLLLLCGAGAGAAQTTNEQQRGFAPGGSYTLGDIESISNSNGNVLFNIALAQLPTGRGGMSGPALRLVYNSKLWDPEPVAMYGAPSCTAGGGCTYPYQGTTTFLKDNKHGGWDYAYDYRMEVIDRRSEGRYPYGGAPSCNANGGGLDLSGANLFKVRLRFPDGGLHEFHATGRTGLEQTSGYYNVSPDGNYYYCQNVGGSGNVNYAVVTTGPSYGTPNIYYTTDGSYLKLVTYGTPTPTGQITNQYWTLYFPDGTRVTTVPAEVGDGRQRIYDRNGNFVQFGGNAVAGQLAALISDQLGRAIRLTQVAGEDVITISGFGGAELKWAVRWRTASLRGKSYYAGQFGIQPFNWSWRVIDRITLPGQVGMEPYVFDYNDKDASGGTAGNSVGWGELSYMKLPSGAYAVYTYRRDGENLSNTAFPVLQNHPVRKELTYLNEYDGQPSQVTERWDYTFNFPGLSTISTATSVTAPDGGVTSESFIDNPGHYNHGLSRGTTLPDGTTIIKVWQENRLGDAIAYRYVEMNPMVKAEYRTVPGSNNTSQTAIKEYSHDKNGNVLQVSEYDWVTYSSFPRDQFGNIQYGVPSGLLPKRVTKNTYHNPTPNSTTQSSNANSYDKATAPAVRNGLASAEVSDGAGQVLSRSEFTYDDPSTTANLTLRRNWDSTKGSLLSPQPDGTRLDANNSVSVRNEYDDNTPNTALRYGNVTLKVDANGNKTKLTYGPITAPDGATYSGLYQTEVVAAEGTSIQRTTTSIYDLSTGLVTKVTDEDNNISTSTTYDDLGRTRLVEEADGELDANGVSLERQTVTEYADSNKRITVRSDLNSTGDGKLVSARHYDQMGRLRLKRILEDATQDAADEGIGIKVQTRYRYSGQNSYVLVSNPYRAATSAAAAGESTMGWAVTVSDRVGRVVKAETFSGAGLPAPYAAASANTNSTGTVVTAYDAKTVTVTDQAGRQRQSVSDALGRLVQVFEAPSVTGYNYLTSYSYDVNNNLKQVVQGEQTRVFNYSSLSRLTSAQNPENGIVQYRHDANGNIILKIDPRPRPGTATLQTCPIPYTDNQIATCYEYDALGRVESRSYNDGTPKVSYTYDASGPNSKGRLSSVSSSVSTSSYTAYDALGRVTGSSQTTDGVTYTMPAYLYNLAGSLISEEYPSGRVVKTEYDAAGRVAGVKNQATGVYYAGGAVNQTSDNRIRYAVGGAPSAVRLGNGLWEHTEFNSRLQPTQIGLGASAVDSGKLRLDYTYGEVVNGVLDSKRNNGNVQSQRIYVAGSLDVTQTYEYDEVNRLKTAEEKAGAASTWKQVYSYDQYGNRNFASGTTYPNYSQSLTDPVGNPVIDTANNRIKTAAPGQGNYVYDAAGNLTRTLITPTAYHDLTYDAENKLVKADGGAPSGTDYSYDGEGRRVKKVAGSIATVFVYDAAGRLVAEYSNQVETKGTRYVTQDQLGSTRVVTDAQGNAHSNSGAGGSRHDYFPFGEEVHAGVGGRDTTQGYVGDNMSQKFAGSERDQETGLDYMKARYYSSTTGRFTGVDPSRKSIISANPQTWNRYSYTYNNPLRYVDENGKWPTEIHNLIIERALGGLSGREKEMIKRGSALVDTAFGTGGVADVPITLLVSEAPKHAMTPGNMSVEQAVAAANTYVKEQMDKARFWEGLSKNKKDGLSDGALLEFGRGTHTYSDNTSPEHGFKVYAVPQKEIVLFLPSGETFSYTGNDWAKWAKDLLEHKAGESRDPTTEEMQRAVDDIRDYFYVTFGDEAFKRAVPDPTERQRIYDRHKPATAQTR